MDRRAIGQDLETRRELGRAAAKGFAGTFDV
jgi:hypothetical protein